MKRSRIQQAQRQATECFAKQGWHLPPCPRWDVTDFGLGCFDRCGLVLVNLAEEPEYCEKLMFCQARQEVPWHTHRIKKEDIICRAGRLWVQVAGEAPIAGARLVPVQVKVNGEPRTVAPGEKLRLDAGWRVTLLPGQWHAFGALEEACVLGEVSTANNDREDNLFLDPEIGRFPSIEEDEPSLVRLVSE